jgi:hypothetical protein
MLTQLGCSALPITMLCAGLHTLRPRVSSLACLLTTRWYSYQHRSTGASAGNAVASQLGSVCLSVCHSVDAWYGGDQMCALQSTAKAEPHPVKPTAGRWLSQNTILGWHWLAAIGNDQFGRQWGLGLFVCSTQCNLPGCMHASHIW